MRVLRVLPRNVSTLLLAGYLLRACLLSRSLATGLHVTIFIEVLEESDASIFMIEN
jgi:hypothetical protein